MAKLFKPTMPKITPAPPTPMPDPEDPSKRAESRVKTARAVKASGRASNKLTAGGRETLGG